MGHVLTGDQLRRAMKKLGEMERQFGQKEYPYDPERALVAMQNIIDGWFGFDIFPTFRTIKLGTGLKTVGDFCRAFKENGCRVSGWGRDILGKITVANQLTTVELVTASVAELGFQDGATREQIYKRAKELGLGLCPAEVGPQFRLQYKNQPMGERLRIAMEPITDSDDDLNVFSVGRSGDALWLRRVCGYPESFWYGGYRWVFLRRK